MVHAALLLLMLEAVTADLVFTISLKRSTQNLQLSTSSPADYPIFWQIVLQKDFGPRSEEHFFQIRPQERSLIQKFGHSDSNIARFWRSGGCRRLLQHNRPLTDLL